MSSRSITIKLGDVALDVDVDVDEHIDPSVGYNGGFEVEDVSLDGVSVFDLILELKGEKHLNDAVRDALG